MPEEAVAINGDAQNLGFVEFAELAYVEILTYKPRYIEFLLVEIGDAEIQEKK